MSNGEVTFTFGNNLSERVEKEVRTEQKKSYSQWSIGADDTYFPTYYTQQQLPSGFYEIRDSQQGPFFKQKKVSTDELYSLPSEELMDVINDIEVFWDRRDEYKKYNFIHKRGILLYGRPGTGKSAIIQLCTKHLIENKNGIVINIASSEDLQLYNHTISSLREIEPDRPLIVILEDVDALLQEGSWAVSVVLNLLDGIKQINNVVYIATTNYPDRLEERVINRPSRFDRRYEVKPPTAEVRREYLKRKLNEDDLKSIDLELWVTESDGFTLSHMRELVVSVVVMGNTFEETISRLKELSTKVKYKSGFATNGVGF